MTEHQLTTVEISNFRSIKGNIAAPLDANVVLVHGENGAGKTSLLSAIELSLTGRINSLQRADNNYAQQLLFRGANAGRVSTTISTNATEFPYEVRLEDSGVEIVRNLEADLASFFSERSFLPQSLLSQLLQIYQDSSSSINSPLAKFVADLLGLDRLDAIETGLQAIKDVRNLRKRSNLWLEKEGQLDELKSKESREAEEENRLKNQLSHLISELNEHLRALDIEKAATEENWASPISNALRLPHEDDLRSNVELSRELSAVVEQLKKSEPFSALGFRNASEALEAASGEYTNWNAHYGEMFGAIEDQFQSLLPQSRTEPDLMKDWENALSLAENEQARVEQLITTTRNDLEEVEKCKNQIETARKSIETIDLEIASLPSGSQGLATILSEISAYFDREICPVCDRDFSECEGDSLSGHVENKVKSLSASAERLISLGKARNSHQSVVTSKQQKIDELQARLVGRSQLNEFERRASQLVALSQSMNNFTKTALEGQRLRSIEVAKRRDVSEFKAMETTISAARETLSAFSERIGLAQEGSQGSLSAFAKELGDELTFREQTLRTATRAQARIRELKDTIKRNIAAQETHSELRENTSSELLQVREALDRGTSIRRQANSLMSAADGVRSQIIRREFNERLNLLWRDLFVRLAPNEPFVPAFSVPQGRAQRLAPKLITNFRDGGNAGGTPGAMLSAGNLNTAALTLFLALHLSVPQKLPWLILDDPVQSMDDIHISNFASLLRTLSKEHSRQIIIAVHDRQLFEYLSLELSPAFPEDTLLTLEMSRSANQDSRCYARRVVYKEDPTLGQVA